MDKISFVIPCFNEEKWIEACLLSIIEELYRTRRMDRAEIIVVNNNSTDRTRELAMAIPGVIVIDEKERGVVAARRAGYGVATGDFIACIDADTVLVNGWLDKVVDEFDRHPNLVALTGPLIYYDLSRSNKLLVDGFYGMAYLLYLVVRLLRLGSMLQGGNAVIRRDTLMKALVYYGEEDQFTFYGEDTETARCLSKFGVVKYDLAFRAYSSSRRLRQEGIAKVGLDYAINYFWTILFKRPYTSNWVDHR